MTSRTEFRFSHAFGLLFPLAQTEYRAARWGALPSRKLVLTLLGIQPKKSPPGKWPPANIDPA
jgi:hypothetical protein